MRLPFSPAPLQSFFLQAVTESEVLKELLKLDAKKTSWSDGLDPLFFKVAAPIAVRPISDLFNLSLLSEEVPIAFKAATVSPLFKEGDQADSNCYRPIFMLPCLSKRWKNLSITNLLAFFMSIVFYLERNLVFTHVMDVSLQP